MKFNLIFVSVLFGALASALPHGQADTVALDPRDDTHYARDDSLVERDEAAEEAIEDEDYEISPEMQAEIDQFMAGVDEIPDSILDMSDKEVTAWAAKNPAVASVAGAVRSLESLEARSPFLEKRWPQWLKCMWALISNIPYAKILKAKKLISKAGGVKKAAKAIVKCKSRACYKKQGKAVLDLVDLLLGVSDIKKNCKL